VAQVRLYLNGFAGWLQDPDPQDVLREPGGRPRGPAMAEAVAIAGVTVSPEGTMDVVFPFHRKFIDPGGVLHPLHVEILPEGGGSHIEHSAPVSLDDVQGLVVHAGQPEGLQHIKPVKSGEPSGAIDGHHFAARLPGIHHSGHGHQCRRLLKPVVSHHFPAEFLHGSRTFRGR